jgi:hypothetical protein
MKDEKERPEREESAKKTEGLSDAELEQAAGGTSRRSGGSGGHGTTPELTEEVYGSGS